MSRYRFILAVGATIAFAMLATSALVAALSASETALRKPFEPLAALGLDVPAMVVYALSFLTLLALALGAVKLLRAVVILADRFGAFIDRNFAGASGDALNADYQTEYEHGWPQRPPGERKTSRLDLMRHAA